jgi:hypothetical protein
VIVQDIIDLIVPRVLESSSSFPSGFWSTDEVVGYVNKVQRDMILKMQALKSLGAVASSVGVRLYAEPADSMQLDRIAFAQQPLVQTNRLSLDLANPAWRGDTGRPQLFHQDELPTKTFETDYKPITGMAGTGYTNTGNYGVLRGMSGAYTYTATGVNGPFRRAYGARPYHSTGVSAVGMLRRMLTGTTNFETVQTVLPEAVSSPQDVLTVPAYMKWYLAYGTMQAMLSKEGEGQDLRRAAYCQSRYLRGINLYRRLVNGAPIGGGAK